MLSFTKDSLLVRTQIKTSRSIYFSCLNTRLKWLMLLNTFHFNQIPHVILDGSMVMEVSYTSFLNGFRHLYFSVFILRSAFDSRLECKFVINQWTHYHPRLLWWSSSFINFSFIQFCSYLSEINEYENHVWKQNCWRILIFCWFFEEKLENRRRSFQRRIDKPE